MDGMMIGKAGGMNLRAMANTMKLSEKRLGQNQIGKRCSNKMIGMIPATGITMQRDQIRDTGTARMAKANENCKEPNAGRLRRWKIANPHVYSQ